MAAQWMGRFERIGRRANRRCPIPPIGRHSAPLIASPTKPFPLTGSHGRTWSPDRMLKDKEYTAPGPQTCLRCSDRQSPTIAHTLELGRDASLGEAETAREFELDAGTQAVATRVRSLGLHPGRACSEPGALHSVGAKQVVFVTAGTVGAAEAADQQHGNTNRHQDGDQASVHGEPMNQAKHILEPTPSVKSFDFT